jgi:hypothetical protein
MDDRWAARVSASGGAALTRDEKPRGEARRGRRKQQEIVVGLARARIAHDRRRGGEESESIAAALKARRCCVARSFAHRAAFAPTFAVQSSGRGLLAGLVGIGAEGVRTVAPPGIRQRCSSRYCCGNQPLSRPGGESIGELGLLGDRRCRARCRAKARFTVSSIVRGELEGGNREDKARDGLEKLRAAPPPPP